MSRYLDLLLPQAHSGALRKRAHPLFQSLGFGPDPTVRVELAGIGSPRIFRVVHGVR